VAAARTQSKLLGTGPQHNLVGAVDPLEILHPHAHALMSDAEYEPESERPRTSATRSVPSGLPSSITIISYVMPLSEWCLHVSDTDLERHLV